MGSKYQKTTLDIARDELMSHVIRCDVLDARMTDRTDWLEETLEYMRDRYPTLSEIQLAKLEMMGKQFIKPAIPHGRGNHAANRPEPSIRTTDGEVMSEDEITEEMELELAPA